MKLAKQILAVGLTAVLFGRRASILHPHGHG